MQPYPIPAYPQNPPPQWPTTDSLARLDASHLPDCNVVHDGAELAVRYNVTRDGECYLCAIKLNGTWHDPVKWLAPSVIRCLQNECAEIEREVRAEGDE